MWSAGSSLVRGFRPSLVRRRFPHANFSASNLKYNLVHCPLHEIDAPALLGLQAVRLQRIGNRTRVKSFSLVANREPDSLSGFAAAMNLNQFVRVHCIAVDDCV